MGGGPRFISWFSPVLKVQKYWAGVRPWCGIRTNFYEAERPTGHRVCAPKAKDLGLRHSVRLQTMEPVSLFRRAHAGHCLHEKQYATLATWHDIYWSEKQNIMFGSRLVV